MEFWVAGAVVTALFMGMNEGAAGVAAAMSGAYGGGVIPRRKALLLVAVFVLLGSVAGSRAIIGTLSKGIVPAGMIDLRTAVVILFAASVCLSAATWLKVPISTSQATVGAITGAGIYLGSFNSAAVLKIVAFWILMPLVAFGLAYWFELKAYSRVLRWFGRMRSPERIRRILSLGALASGCFMAFSFGTNNAGNVAAPLVGAGFWSPGAGALISGLFLGAGALVLGGRLLGTTREIHTLCSIKAGVLTIIAAALVIGASAAGIPVPLVQIVPAGAMGMTCCQSGLRETAGKEVVRRILRTWALSPVVSMGIVLAGLHLAGAGAGAGAF